MKKPGIIGGLGPESTINYYRMIVSEFQSRLKTFDYPEILINSVNMTELLNYAKQNNKKVIADILIEKVNELQRSGADFAAIASNSPHLVFKEITEATSLPLVNIVQVTCENIQSSSVGIIGLLGTKLTMSDGFFQREAAKYGIKIVTPAPSSQEYIERVYMKEILHNTVVQETKNKLIRIVRELIEIDSITGLILGGVEFPFILSQSDFHDIKVFDSGKLHVMAIVDKMIS
jgi:aspartate racemase